MFPPVSTPGSTPSSSVVNINDVVHLSGDLHAPHLAEQDAISARATVSSLLIHVRSYHYHSLPSSPPLPSSPSPLLSPLSSLIQAGSSSPVSSISGFSTNSHLEDGGEEGGREDKQRPDPFASSSASSADPFAAFSVPIDSFASSGAIFSGKPSDLSAFDPFGPSDPFKVRTAASSLFLTIVGHMLSSSSSTPPTRAPPLNQVSAKIYSRMTRLALLQLLPLVVIPHTPLSPPLLLLLIHSVAKILSHPTHSLPRELTRCVCGCVGVWVGG